VTALLWPVAPVADAPGHQAVDVGGHQVHVWCDDAPLAPATEAWATAFCLPAARAGATLSFGEPLDRAWVAGAAENVAVAAEWWGGSPHLQIDAPRRARRWPFGPERLRTRPPAGRPGPPAPGRALCFTGGVDSFFSLLDGDHSPTHLLYVVGFDVAHDDAARADEVTSAVQAVAAERGLDAIIVTTDLREHPLFAAISWEHTHGAALAAIAHLLAPTIGTVIIPPSYAERRLEPWGSRPDLDPRWSRPGRTQIEHGDASGRRVDRVQAIAGHPLVHRHLRVCWQNVGTDLNCSRCEKCVRTMAMLAAFDQLDACETFTPRAELPGAIDGIGQLPPAVAMLWADLLELDGPGAGLRTEERSAIRRVVDRSLPT
jgi:hypothetical protein